MIEGLNIDILGLSSFWTVIFAIVFFFIVAFIIIIKNQLKYNCYVDINELVGSSYKLHRTKGGVFTDSNGVRYFKSKKFGKSGKQVIYREPSNELFADYEHNMFDLPFLPRVQSEEIGFLNPFGETFIPVRRSFISIKRGVDLRITSKEDCEFCKKGVKMTDFISNPGLYLEKIKDMDRVCEKHFSDLINARYECIDQSDLSWMWKNIDDLKKDFGDFMLKFAPLVTAGLILVFVAFTVLIVLKTLPDVQDMASEWNMKYLESLKISSVANSQNITYPTN